MIILYDIVILYYKAISYLTYHVMLPRQIGEIVAWRFVQGAPDIFTIVILTKVLVKGSYLHLGRTEISSKSTVRAENLYALGEGKAHIGFVCGATVDKSGSATVGNGFELVLTHDSENGDIIKVHKICNTPDATL